MQGNIVTITTNGLIAPGVYGVVDDLTATFNGNQLLTLTDNASDVLLESSLDLRSGQFGRGSFDYDANGNQTRDLSRSVDEVVYNPLNLPTVVTMADGSTIRYLYTAAGAKLSEIAISADGDTLSRRDYVSNLEITAKGDSLHDRRLLLAEGYITLADTTFHAYIPDYKGNIIAVYNTRTDETEQQTDYYPYGLPHADTEASTPQSNRRKYGAKELMTDHGLNLYDFEARLYNSILPSFLSIDLCSEQYYKSTPFSFCDNNPINNVDPVGLEPIFSNYGYFLGCTAEGYTGQIYIYTGREYIDFNMLTIHEALIQHSTSLMTMDNAIRYGFLSQNTISKIWTHVVHQFDNMPVYEKTFSVNSLFEKRILYGDAGGGHWSTTLHSDPIIIEGRGSYNIYLYSGYGYESTVENIASSIIIHEWYSHGIHGVNDRQKSHRLAIEAVIRFARLWNKTTENYKKYNLRLLQYHTKKETGHDVKEKEFIDLINFYKLK